MKCDHSHSVVLESRRLGAVRFRSRECNDCYEKFVTMEEQKPGLKMPAGTQSRNRKKHEA